MNIFDLRTSTSELESSNSGVAKNIYEQIPSSRDCTGDNFPNGAIHFRFHCAGTKWWVPNRSYLRFRIQLSKASNAKLDQNDDIAPAMNHVCALFQSAEFRINDKTVSRISDYLPQIDTLNTRLNKSKSWIDSVGRSTNFWESEFKVRQLDVATPNSRIYTREELGFPDAATIAAVAATGVITFAGMGTFNLRTVLNVNDYITFGVYVLKKIISIGDGVIGVGAGVFNADIVAAPVAFTIKKSIPGGDLEDLSDKNENKNVSIYEVTWCPPLSIFQINHALPVGKYELVLNPETSSVYKKAIIESELVSKTPETDYKLNIQNLYLYVNTLEASRVDNLSYYLDLEQMSCQSENLSGSVSFGQKNFDVSPSTKSLCVAFQDTRVKSDTRCSATKFRSYNAAISNKNIDQGLFLSRYFVNYAGINQPSPDADNEYADGQKDVTTQRYVESLLASGSYHDNGGSETLKEYQSRGAYLLTNFNKDGNDRSTRVAVHTGFGTGVDLSYTRMLLFSISSQVCRIVIENGNISSVDLEDI